MKNKLLKCALMLGTLIGCLATAAWAGNVETDWLDGTTDCDVALEAEGYYQASQEYSNTWASYPDSKVTYDFYFNSDGAMTWGRSTSHLGTETYRNEYDADGNPIKLVMSSDVDGREVAVSTYTYDADGVLTQSHFYNSFKGGSAEENTTYYYTYGENEITVKAYCSDPYGDSVISYVYTLDDNGNIVKCAYQSETEDYDYSGTVSYTYDARGNLTMYQNDEGDVCVFEYNDKDLCVKKTYVSGDGGETVTTYEYDEHGNVLRKVRNNYDIYTCTYKAIPQGGSQSDFDDVAASAYYNTPVIWATETGVTAGVGDNRFAPNESCTRAQLVTFLWRAAGRPEPETTVSPFTDVQNPNEYYYKAVLWAVENKITAGIGNNQFGPNQSCTRGQIVTFIYNASGDQATYSDNPFRDVKTGDFYYNAVLWAVANGITAGTSDTTFSPNETCTRAQGVSFLYRGIGLY